MKNKPLEYIFSVKNFKKGNRYYKVCTILGIKIKKRNKLKEFEEYKNSSKKALDKEIANINKNFRNEIRCIKTRLQKFESYNYLKSHSINKEEIDVYMEKFKSLGITNEKRDTKLIVSLTSYPKRLYDIHYTIFSLLNQTVKPDEIILWLAEEQFPNREDDLPNNLLKMTQYGLTIKWWKEDIKSYKKLIPALIEYPDDIIVTADDDIYYEKNWLESLYHEYLKSNRETVIANRCHKIRINDNEILPYIAWDKETINYQASSLILPTGCGGCLYPPHIFNDEMLKQEKFMQLCPNADDIWFWGMAVLNNTGIKTLENPLKIKYTNPYREFNPELDGTLYSMNGINGNDTQIQNLLQEYPEIKERVLKEFVKVSVIIPVYNTAQYLPQCLDSICNQTLKNIEIICVNDGSTDNSEEILKEYAAKDSRIIVVNKENSGAADSRNLGIDVAKGEYIGFVDSDDWVDLNYYEELYNKASAEHADFVRCPYKLSFPDEENDDSLNKIIDNAIREKRNLKPNEHSCVVWNAIYSSHFLKTNKILFDFELPPSEDVLFTAEVTFKARNMVPLNSTYYHYRQDREGQVSRPSLKKLSIMILLNNKIADFLNSLQNASEADYIEAYERILHRVYSIYALYKQVGLINETNEKEYVYGYIEIFQKCKYPDKLKYSRRPYYNYLKIQIMKASEIITQNETMICVKSVTRMYFHYLHRQLGLVVPSAQT